MILNAVKVGVAVAVIWYLVIRGALDWSGVRSLGYHRGTIGGIIAMCLLMYWISIVRWQLLLACQKIQLGVRDASSATFVSLFLNCFFPGGGFGGDSYRAAYLMWRYPGRRTAAVLSVCVDRCCGLYALVVVATTASFLHLPLVLSNPALLWLAICAWLLLLGIPAIVLMACKCMPMLRGTSHGGGISWVDAIKSQIIMVGESATSYMRTPHILLMALGLSIVIQVTAVTAVGILGRSLQFTGMSILDYSFAAPWGWLAGLFPATFGGLGVSEAAFDYVCHLLMSGDGTVGYATIFLSYRVLAMCATLPGLVLWFLPSDSFKWSTPSRQVVE